MNKKLFLNDTVGIKEDCSITSNLRTKVTLTDHDTGIVLFSGHNKLILPGAEFLALSMFDLADKPITPSYNTKLDLDDTVYTPTPQGTNKTYLFCIGTDGCGTENSQVYEEDYRKWIMPSALVPFQYVPPTKDLSTSQRNNYYGRKTGTDFISYYFKGFDSPPQLKREFTTGTSIDDTIYDYTGTVPVQTYVSMAMSITKDDCRDYFINTTGIKDARANSISLCTAWAKTISGFTYYQDIRPVTKLNFPNEALIDLRKSIDISYQVYF